MNYIQRKKNLHLDSHRKLASFGIFFFMVIVLSGCNWFSQSDGEVMTELVAKPKKVLLWEIGSTRNLKPVVNNQKGVPVSSQPTFIFSSSASNIASVDSAGLVTAVAVGTAVINIKAADFSVDVPVTVTLETVRLHGVITYQDKVYSSDGFTNEEKYLPVRFSESEIADENGDALVVAKTDANGSFDVVVGANNQYRIRVVAKSSTDNGVALVVKNWNGAIYAAYKDVTRTPIDTGDMQADVKIPADVSIAGVFNMYDVMMTGIEFAQYLTSTKEVALNVIWQQGRAAGTYFCEGNDLVSCPQGTGIYVQNATSGSIRDTDEYDDDVLWHEFGHFIVAKFSRDDSIGGCHRLASNDLDLRLAWSEGWGDFFPTSIKTWLKTDPQRAQRLSSDLTTPVSQYVDLVLVDIPPYSTKTISINIANPDGQEVHRYASSEIAIAKVLWEINKNYGVEKIWRVIQDYLKTVTPVNLEAFWDGYLATEKPDAATRATLENILSEREIFYIDDNAEPNDSISDAALLSVDAQSALMHLYHRNGSADVDYFKFEAQANTRYTIATVGLLGGTDTYLKVVNAANSFSTSSDDYFVEAKFPADKYGYERYDEACDDIRVFNDELSLASRVTFVAPNAGTFYIMVSTTVDNDPYPSAARYGSYKVDITSAPQ